MSDGNPAEFLLGIFHLLLSQVQYDRSICFEQTAICDGHLVCIEGAAMPVEKTYVLHAIFGSNSTDVLVF